MESNSVSPLLALNGYLLPIVLTGVLAVALAVVLVITARLRRLERRYVRLLGAEGRGDAETLLLDYIDRADQLARNLERTQEQLDRLETASTSHVQHVGVVRYDAFEDVGGALSFSVALLDDAKNGVVITGMAGRYETRIYAKAVRAGRSPHVLSTEELQAIAKAVETRSDVAQD
ncbi:MAG: hypothetical protein BWY85_01312 [Firmicutes bacterium ADurb.Bin506]|jgi:hypothetical protein|nr:MAG: hypothetical protein BWY85_01312 [Firmicutes bacterium ADurb.Bin506]